MKCWLILLIIVAAFIVFADYACCKVAGDDDERMGYK